MNFLKKYSIYFLTFSFFMALFSHANSASHIESFKNDIPICTSDGLKYVKEDVSQKEKSKNENYHTNCLDCFSCHFDEINKLLTHNIFDNNLINKKYNFYENFTYISTINYFHNIRGPPVLNI